MKYINDDNDKHDKSHAFLYGSFKPDGTIINQGVLELISEGSKVITPSSNNSAVSVMVIGKTGTGKSTLVNLLMGESLEGKYDRDSFGHIIHGSRIGHKTTSETTVPNFLEDKTNNIIYWDCPGFDDTKGPAQEVANAFYIERIFSIARNIKLLVAVPFGNIKETKPTVLLELLNKLDNLFNGNTKDLKPALSIVITKSENHHAIDMISGKCKKILEEDNCTLSPFQKEILKYIKETPKIISIFPAPDKEGSLPKELAIPIFESVIKNTVTLPGNIEVKITVNADSAKMVRTLSTRINIEIDETLKKTIENFKNSLDLKTISYEAIKDCQSKAKVLENTVKTLTSNIEPASSKIEGFLKAITNSEILSKEEIEKLEGHLSTINFCIKVDAESKNNVRPNEWISIMNNAAHNLKENINYNVIKLRNIIGSSERHLEEYCGVILNKLNSLQYSSDKHIFYTKVLKWSHESYSNPVTVGSIKNLETLLPKEITSVMDNEKLNKLIDSLRVVELNDQSSPADLTKVFVSFHNGLNSAYKDIKNHDFSNYFSQIIQNISDLSNDIEGFLQEKNGTKFLTEQYKIFRAIPQDFDSFITVIKVFFSKNNLKSINLSSIEEDLMEVKKINYEEFIKDRWKMLESTIQTLQGHVSMKYKFIKESNMQASKVIIKKDLGEICNYFLIRSNNNQKVISDYLKSRLIDNNSLDSFLKKICDKAELQKLQLSNIEGLLSWHNNIKETINLIHVDDQKELLNSENLKIIIDSLNSIVAGEKEGMKIEDYFNKFCSDLQNDIDRSTNTSIKNQEYKIFITKFVAQLDQLTPYLVQSDSMPIASIVLHIKNNILNKIHPNFSIDFKQLDELGESGIKLKATNALKPIIELRNKITDSLHWREGITKAKEEFSNLYKDTEKLKDNILAIKNSVQDGANTLKFYNNPTFKDTFEKIGYYNPIAINLNRSSALETIFQQTLGCKTFETTSSGVKTIYGNFIKTSNIKTEGIHTVCVGAFDTLLIDTVISAPGVNFIVIANKWQLALHFFQDYNFELSEKPGGVIDPFSNAREPLRGVYGSDGSAGNYGGNGGSFFGIGKTFEGISGLRLGLNGGNGGGGQDGQSGGHGGDGDDASKSSYSATSTTDWETTSSGVRWSAVEMTKIYYGSLGGSGGRGGKGGEGGYGGYPGKLKIKNFSGYEQKISPDNYSSETGSKGADGKCEQGGTGGKYGDYLKTTITAKSGFTKYYDQSENSGNKVTTTSRAYNGENGSGLVRAAKAPAKPSIANEVNDFKIAFQRELDKLIKTAQESHRPNYTPNAEEFFCQLKEEEYIELSGHLSQMSTISELEI